MNAITSITTVAVACAVALSPALCLAAAPNSTVPGVPASYTWGDSHTASALLQDMGREASNIARGASALEVDSNAPELKIQRIETEVDHLNQRLHRLDGVRKQIVPVGQAALQRATPYIEAITQNAAVAEDEMRDGRQSATFQSALEDLQTQASSLAEQMGAAVPLERAQNEQMYLAKNAVYLQKNLGMLVIFR